MRSNGHDVDRGDGLLALVARLYYLDDLGQQAIAEMVGVSRPTVSRLLTRARARGIVRIEVSPYDPRDAALEAALCDRFGLRRAVVVKTVAEASVTQARRAVGYFGGPVVCDWLRPQSIVGLAGGRTLRELVDHMTPDGDPPAEVGVVQLMGNLGSRVSHVDATELCHTLARRLQGQFFALSAPAVAPDATTQRAFMAHANMTTVWRLFEAMQIAVVGIGTLEDSVFIERNALRAAELETLRRSGAVGEICGRFYDAMGNECQSAYHSRVISVSLDQLRAVPEVVGVTNGGNRAAAIRAAIKGGLLKSIVIDELGATALLRE